MEQTAQQHNAGLTGQAEVFPRQAQVSYITLECNRGDHEGCPGAGSSFKGTPKQPCKCIHHIAGVVLPEGFSGRT